MLRRMPANSRITSYNVCYTKLLRIERRVGHLRDARHANFVEGAHHCFQVLAATALDCLAVQAADQDRVTGIGVALGADRLVRADLFADTAAAAVVFDIVDLFDDRHGREAP